jgi:hypothetical protein
MRSVRACALLALAILPSTACTKDDSSVRGRGLTVATLPATSQAHVYEAALRSAFEVDDQGLSLLLDARELPRGVGLAASTRLPDGVAPEMRRRGAVKGSCEPSITGKPPVPICKAALPGYVVRFSPVFALKADSVQVYVYVQKYDIPGGERSDKLRFERAYQVVKRGDDWKAVREGRVSKEIRGESK